jgi:hypothetical protein
MWGARGPFPPAAAMVVAVVTPVVLCNKATENFNKNTKTSYLQSMFVCITIYCKTYYHSRITSCSVDHARVVWWPEPKPLWSNGPRHIGYRRKALVIVRTILTLYRGQNLEIMEKERKGNPHHT